jgi:hypothetical protein
MMRTPKTPTMPTFWRAAPFVVLVLIAAAAFGSAWHRDRVDRARADQAAAKADRLDRYCHLMRTTVENARQLAATDRAGVAIWNDLVMYDARALVPCLHDEAIPSDRELVACADGDAACVRHNADAALMWFERE